MTNQLSGKRILVVEDDPLISENLAYEIAEAGAQVVGPAGNVGTALDLVANSDLDGASLNVKLMDETSLKVADALADRNVPFLFWTGCDDRDEIPARHAKVSFLEKPAPLKKVRRALEAMLGARRKVTLS
jgi:DNA-binding response OmpR family regulator